MIFNMTAEDWDIVLKVNLYGHFNCTRPACVVFREQRSGRIINTSSEAGLGNMGQANYGAAKEGVVGFTRVVARDMGKYGATCNCIRPRAGTRAIRPESLVAQNRARDEGIQLAIEPGVDFSKLDPHAVAPLVVFLASDEAANINGCTFYIAGGQISLYSEPTLAKTIFKDGMWTQDELSQGVPATLAHGLIKVTVIVVRLVLIICFRRVLVLIHLIELLGCMVLRMLEG